ncbi:MAG: efflux transporter periplasmic adaptor subunit [Stygiobacter sp. RIFOXYC12_FULL_38_8]|nr:MAG: efflux transporter periplasmic adaptor subunit [Stygiobacter sp. RIFOXYA12_FULL_38_9]OGV06428.1 MAG: efflux transporter periplasmic adaptor subunit [Stygiobacter sp. RIFOXYB2_FULL_37_11]OGV10248.1 MAG: efflux transporter periplasmic adaptor subunit [Stygiobacter sp. RIFOXYA2_FULL_38_8]OGV14022.1 MAG: efflux transporter periplasmic adaptor subunit [Stygiobacter sp. RIFOXYC2_FULL_38_25]OGV30348.1 MAG: efflux transporter periplasmic adaptor subunit [Stygiobacter sp. RIFOXYC12_FULL_38_8]OG
MANGKKTKKKLFIFGGLGLLVVVILLLVVFGGDKENIVNVQTEKVEKRTITQVVSATGKINPVYQVMISAEATGEIVYLGVKEGDVVRKGQLLVRIKPDIYEAQRNNSAARLEQSKASLSSTKAQLDKVESDYKRVQGLFQKKLASDSELEASKAIYLQTLGSYESQKSFVVQSEAALKESNETLNKTYVYAPMNGTISKLSVELAQRVLGSNFSPGTEILTVADLSQMEARVDVDENDVVLVSVGDEAKVKVDAFGDKEFKGKVTQIGNSAVSKGLGTQDEVVNFEVRVLIDDPGKQLRPGMSCDADVKTETKANVLAVPIQSVTARMDKPMMKEPEGEGGDMAAQEVKPKNGKANKAKEVVFITKDNKAKMIEVKTGISDDTYIEIQSGLSGGEDVVSGPYRAISKELEEGTKISLQSKRSGDKEKK